MKAREGQEDATLKGWRYKGNDEPVCTRRVAGITPSMFAGHSMLPPQHAKAARWGPRCCAPTGNGVANSKRGSSTAFARPRNPRENEDTRELRSLPSPLRQITQSKQGKFAALSASKQDDTHIKAKAAGLKDPALR